MNTDGWTRCDLGHRHWGLVGAAGLFLVSHDDRAQPRVLLQHRSAQVHHGLTWGIPGGALAIGETAERGALREAREELTGIPDDVTVVEALVEDHGGWSYTTIVATTERMFDPGSRGWETGGGGHVWATVAEVDLRLLHPGFATSWPLLRARLR